MLKTLLFSLFLVFSLSNCTPTMEQVQEPIRVDERDLEGFILVHFWAIWCESCKIELRDIDSDQFYQYIGSNHIKFILVSTDYEPKDAYSYLKENHPNLLRYLKTDPNGDYTSAFQISYFPASVVFKNRKKIGGWGYQRNSSTTKNLQAVIEKEKEKESK